MKFFVSGGYPKKGHEKEAEGFKYDRAFLMKMAWNTGEVDRELVYRSPAENRDPSATMQFKAGALCGNEILMPSGTEVLSIDTESLNVKEVISLPSFNDLHCVGVGKDGNLYVANTGLEMIQVLSRSGELVSETSVASIPTWERFDKNTDYRFTGSTKPHEVHTNYVFFLDGQPWHTRFHQKDAVCLTDTRQKINLNVSSGMPHDGKVVGDYIYFTITDGFVVIVDRITKKTAEILDLNELSGKRQQLGWCRGIEVVGDRVFVGFSKLRISRFKEYGQWVRKGEKPLSSRIAEYDVNTRRLIKETPVGGAGGAAIFTIIKA